MKYFLSLAVFALTSLSATAQSNYELGLRTGVSSNFYLSANYSPSYNNYPNTAIQNQIFGSKYFGKNENFRIEITAEASTFKRIAEEYAITNTQPSPYYYQTTKTKITTLSPTLNASYGILNLKNLKWRHYAGVQIQEQFQFFNIKSYEYERRQYSSGTNYTYSNTFAGLHYSGIIQLGKHLNANYRFAINTLIPFESLRSSPQPYNYSGAFGLGYRF